jgi:hypothetical protein
MTKNFGGPIKVPGLVESTSGGVKFPDGTTQTSAATANTTSVLLRDWTEGESYEMTSITYDGTYTSVVSSATVKWPDGSTGTFTTTTINATWVAIDAYTVSHTDSGLTVTQSAVTRNGAGNITTKPALTIA